jgi:hypothetical protein
MTALRLRQVSLMQIDDQQLEWQDLVSLGLRAYTDGRRECLHFSQASPAQSLLATDEATGPSPGMCTIFQLQRVVALMVGEKVSAVHEFVGRRIYIPIRV